MKCLLLVIPVALCVQRCAHVSPTAASVPAAARATAVALGDELKTLSVAVEAFVAAKDGARRERLRRVVVELSGILTAMKTEGAAPAKLAALASHLEQASRTDDARRVQQALVEALRSMIGRPVPQDQRRAYWQALEVMGRGIDTLKPDQPLILQRTALVTSVQAAVDAVFLANDAEPPFESAADAENLFPARSLADNLSQARADVLALGRAGFGTVRFAFSRSLGSLADCLESADTANAQAAHVAELRFQAERLKRSDSLAFGQAGWSKAGLLAALDALDGIALAKGSGWSQAARTVVEGITDRDSVAFQRAALQDGFRATVDAFTAQLSRTHLVR